MKKFKFNLNNAIYVKLFEDGYEWMSQENKESLPNLPQYHHPAEYYKSKADTHGYTKFQAWEFIRLFGSKIMFGGRQLFDINILIELPHNTTTNSTSPITQEKIESAYQEHLKG